MKSSRKQNSNTSDTQTVDWGAELQEHDHWLRTVVRARLGDLHGVEDVMQEVAAAAIEQRWPLTDPSRAAAWLYRVTVRQVLLFRRRLGRKRKITDRWIERTRPVEGDAGIGDPLQWLLKRERQALIREAIKRIPRKYAEILMLKYQENWSYRQLSTHLGISHSAVESRLHRARKHMRKILSELKITEL